MREPRVSIVIPTRDGLPILAETLESIARQEAPFEHELVAVDSGSSDGTLALLEQHRARVLPLAPDAFDHGRARNSGVEASRGELVALLVQDAVPANPLWLKELVAPLLEDPGVAGSFARQRPRPGASALTRCMLSRWVAAGDRPRVIQPLDEEELARLSPAARLERCAFDNVSSCIRRSVWERIPFRPGRIAEDLTWGREALLHGHRLAFAAGAEVLHSHERALGYELGRTYLLHRRLTELLGYRTVPGAAALALAVAVSAAAHLRCLLRAHGAWVPPRQLWRAVGLSVVWPLGQYLGGRSAVEGRELLRVRGV